MGMMDSKEAEYMNIPFSVQEILRLGIFAKIKDIDLFITGAIKTNDIKGHVVIDHHIKMLEESISFYRKEFDLPSPTQMDRSLNQLKDKWERTKMTFNQQKRTV
jgi:hypothetical protein